MAVLLGERIEEEVGGKHVIKSDPTILPKGTPAVIGVRMNRNEL